MKSKLKSLQNPSHVNKIFEILQKTWPNAKCELIANNHFQFLLAVMLSAQTTDKSVNKALEPLLKSNPSFSPKDLLEMGSDKFFNIIKTIGLARTKSKNAYRTSQILVEKFHGKVPHTREELESLPGVGRKTANVVLNNLFNWPLIAVDTHVARVSQRLGLVKQTNDRLKIEHELVNVLPEKFLSIAHHLLIFHGRYLCTARAPKCAECPLNELCPKIGVL